MNFFKDTYDTGDFSTLIKNRNFDELIDVLQAKHAHNNLEASDSYLLGRLLAYNQDFSTALTFMERARLDYEHLFSFNYQLGKIAFRAEEFCASKSAFRQALAINPNASGCHIALAITHFRLGEYSKAATNFEKSESLTNKYTYLASIFGTCKVITGRQLYPTENYALLPELIITSGLENCTFANDQKGFKLLEKVLLNAPKKIFSEIQYWTPSTYQQANDKVKKRLRRYLRKIWSRFENSNELSTSVNDCLGKLYFIAEDHLNAQQFFDAMLAKDMLNLSNLKIAGQCFAINGSYNKAIIAFRKFSLEAPDDQSIYFLMARAHLNLGNDILALKNIKIHLNILPRDVKALYWLTLFAIDYGNEAFAEQQLIKIERLKPDTKITKKAQIEFKKAFGRSANQKSTLADYSLVDWSKIEIPNDFRFSGSAQGPTTDKSMMATVKDSSNVISALILREMTTRFGRNGLGYLWAVIQQIVFIGVLALLFEFRGRSMPYGVSTLTFLITGFNAFFIFRTTRSQMNKALEKNKSILYFRQISPFIIYFAKAALEILTGILIFAMLVGASVLLGDEINMSSLLQVLGILALLGFFGSCFGLFVSSVSVYFPAIKHFDGGLNRVLFFTSGIFYYANELPKDLREILMWNPLFHLIELLREGFFNTYTAHYASLEYVFAWTFGFCFIALVMERISRDRILEP